MFYFCRIWFRDISGKTAGVKSSSITVITSHLYTSQSNKARPSVETLKGKVSKILPKFWIFFININKNLNSYNFIILNIFCVLQKLQLSLQLHLFLSAQNIFNQLVTSTDFKVDISFHRSNFRLFIYINTNFNFIKNCKYLCQ